MKSRCPFIESADSYIHDEMTASEIRSFELHVQSCAECSNEVNKLRLIRTSLSSAFSVPLDERFNYSVLNILRDQKGLANGHEVREAFGDILISLVSLLVIMFLGVQLFQTPHRASPVEMVGGLTKVEQSSLQRSALTDDQVVEIALRGR